MRYERMFLAALMAVACAALSTTFLGMAAQVTARLNPNDIQLFQGAGLQVANLGLLGASLLTLASAFLCFTVSKVQIPGQRATAALTWVQILGRRLAWLAIVLGLCSVAANLAAALWN